MQKTSQDAESKFSLVPSKRLLALRDRVSGRPALDVLEEIAGALKERESFVLTSHQNPDGDAIGSATALLLALRALGKKARVVTTEPPPEKFQPFLQPGLMELVTAAEAPKLFPADFCILLDTSEPERSGAFEPFFFAPGQRRISMDHHPGGKGRFDLQLVVPEAPATGSLVLALVDCLGVPLEATMARMLWIAIATDTGWFRFSNTTPWALADASRLLEFGFDPEALYRQIYQDLSAARARILGAILGGIRLELGGAFVWSSLPRSVQVAEGVGITELDGMIDHLKSIRGAQVVALLVELEPGKYKASLRASSDVDVAAIARGFGGGGHPRAAGCRYSGREEDLVALLTRAVRAELESKKRAGAV